MREIVRSSPLSLSSSSSFIFLVCVRNYFVVNFRKYNKTGIVVQLNRGLDQKLCVDWKIDYNVVFTFKAVVLDKLTVKHLKY